MMQMTRFKQIALAGVASVALLAAPAYAGVIGGSAGISGGADGATAGAGDAVSTTTPHVIGTPNALDAQATGAADMATKDAVKATNSAKDGGASASGQLGADVDADAEAGASVH
tara:strand:+ start:759 stop:1100 length:342 start_codon:yes stop_codon:yes gene_type:complete